MILKVEHEDCLVWNLQSSPKVRFGTVLNCFLTIRYERMFLVGIESTLNGLHMPDGKGRNPIAIWIRRLEKHLLRSNLGGKIGPLKRSKKQRIITMFEINEKCLILKAFFYNTKV